MRISIVETMWHIDAPEKLGLRLLCLFVKTWQLQLKAEMQMEKVEDHELRFKDKN